MPFDIIPIIAILVTFGVPGAIIVTLAKLRHNEKMEMIRQGMYPEQELPKYPGRKSLLWGILLLGLGLASVASSAWRHDTDLIHFGLLAIGAGAALLVYWKVTTPEREREIRLIEEKIHMNSSRSTVVNTQPQNTEFGSRNLGDRE